MQKEKKNTLKVSSLLSDISLVFHFQFGFSINVNDTISVNYTKLYYRYSVRNEALANSLVYVCWACKIRYKIKMGRKTKLIKPKLVYVDYKQSLFNMVRTIG